MAKNRTDQQPTDTTTDTSSTTTDSTTTTSTGTGSKPVKPAWSGNDSTTTKISPPIQPG